ncbi:MAG: ribokinase [Azospirillaceae bacterium]
MTVIVVGNATVDLSFRVDRLPAPGETLLARERVVDAGGKGLNQAVVARRAGATVLFRAPVGDDADAAVIRDRLAAEDMSDDDLVTRPGATDQSILWVAEDGENVIVSTADRARGLTVGEATAPVEHGRPGDIVLVQGNLARAATAAVLTRARERGLTTMLNPAPIHFDYAGLWSLVDIAVVNAVEARALGGDEGGEPAGIEAAGRALRAAGAGSVVVTLGREGAWWTGPAGEGRVPAPSVEAVDTSGAGDVFCGVVAARLAAGLDLDEAVAPAVAAAAVAVLRRGTSSAFPSAAEIAALFPAARRVAG